MLVVVIIAYLCFLLTPSSAQAITSISPKLLPTSGGTLTISGTGLNNPVAYAVGDPPYYGTTLIPGLVVTVPGSQFTCNLLGSTGANKSIVVYVNTNYEMYTTNAFSFLPPTITGISNMSPNGGWITITGTNFGDSTRMPYISVTTTIPGGYTCTTMKMVVNHTALACQMPNGAGEGWITLTSNGQSSNAWPISYHDWCEATVSTTNYMLNAGFESTTDWTLQYIPLTSTQITGGCGQYSLMASQATIPANSIASVYQANSPFSHSPATNFYISLWVQGNDVNCGGSACELQFSLTQGLNDVFCYLTPPNGVYNWTNLRTICSMSNPGNIYTAWGFSADVGGALYLDNLIFCYFGDGGCTYDILAGTVLYSPWGWFFDPPYATTVNYNSHRCIVFPSTSFLYEWGVGAYGNMYVNYWTTLVFLAATSSSTTVTMMLNDYTPISISVSTSWTQYSYAFSNWGSPAQINSLIWNIPVGVNFYITNIGFK